MSTHEYDPGMEAAAYGPNCIQIFSDEDRQVNLFRADAVLKKKTKALEAENAALRAAARKHLDETPEWLGGCCHDSYCAPCCTRVALENAALPKEGEE